jgi:uncharacterized membrane protein
MTLRTANPHALNGAQLKAIAMVTMLIDHMAVVFLEQLYPYVVDMAVFDTQTIVYITMRLIGRLAFPIFAYLLVVGFYHTKNIKKYAFRLCRNLFHRSDSGRRDYEHTDRKSGIACPNR